MIRILMKKELKQYFSSPIAYILIFFFSFTTALWTFRFQAFFVQDTANFRAFFNVMPFFFIILVPAVTMRTWAEEQKSGAEQLLLTLPFSEWQLVFGKFFSALVLFFIMLLGTISIPISILPFGDFEIGVLIANYIGLLFIIAAEVSIGCFLSSISRNQISNFLVTALVLLLITFIGFFPGLISFPQWLGGTIKYISVLQHFESFVKGLLDTRDILYFIIVTALFLFLNRQVLIDRKWR